jgi:predicted component of type VI protein secretion system
MGLKLKVLDGKHAGQEVPVPGNRFFIGRAEDCQLRPGSDLISRHHCVILVEDGYIGVRDLGSKNGTQVNGESVVGERELISGDHLKVGPLEFEVVVSTGVGGQKRPAITGGIKEAATRAADSIANSNTVDVSQWIATDPAETHKPFAMPSAVDTSEIEIGNTTKVVQLVDLESLMADSPTKAEEPKVDPKTDPKAKKPPGKLPLSAHQQSKDSRDAATKMLEMMRKRR